MCLYTSGDIEILKLMFANGAEHVKPCSMCFSEIGYNDPLFLAVANAKRDVVELLLAKGAVFDKISFGHTPRFWAAFNGNHEVAELLWPKVADFKTKSADTSAHLSTNGKPKKKADVNNESAETSELMLAAFSGNLDLVNKLLGEGVDVNVKDRDSCTALMWAAVSGKRDVAKLLLTKGADVNAKIKSIQLCPACGNTTALHFATVNGNRDMVEFLLSNGADINAKSDVGATALPVAASNDKTDIAELLKKAGAKETPTAIEAGNAQLVVRSTKTFTD
jgi:ankyrin repeat protein